MTICHSCNSERVKASPLEYKMYQRAKVRAKESKREFTIVLEDIKIPTYCPILGIKLQSHKGSGGRINSPSLDRIDNDKGYTPDNIQVISHLANCMKANANKKQLIAFAKWVFKTFGTE